MVQHADIDHSGLTGVGVGDATAHIADTTDAHDASAVSFDATGLSNTSATELQTAMEDFDAAIDAAGGGGGGISPGQTVNYPSAFSGDTINGSSTAPFVDIAAFDTKQVLNSRILHLQTLGASKTDNVRVTLGTTKAAAFDVRVCCAFDAGAWTSTDDSTYFEVRGSTSGDSQLFACRFFPFNAGGTPRILGSVLKTGGSSMAAVNDNLDPHVRSAETVTLRWVRDGSNVITPTYGFGTAPMSMGIWRAASDHTPKTFTVSGTLARIEFKIVTPSGPGGTVPFNAYVDYLSSV